MNATNIPLNGTSATLPADMFTGQLRWQGGKEYILVKNLGASLADGKVCKRDATVGADITVIVGNAAADITVMGVNNTGAAIPDGHYFWALRKGRGYTTGSTIAINLFAAPGAAGVVAAAATGNASIGICIEANLTILWDCTGRYNG